MSRSTEKQTEFLTALYDDDSRRKKLLTAYVITFCIVAVLEVVVGLVMAGLGKLTFNGIYVLKYVVLPSSINAIACVVTFVVINSNGISGKTKNYVEMGVLWVMVLVVTIVHAHFPIGYAAFAIPVFITVNFLEKKITVCATVLGVAGAFISASLALVFDPAVELANNYISAGIASALIIVTCLISNVIIGFYEDRESELFKANKDKARLTKQIRIDGLTGLRNHTAFYSDLEDALQTARSRRVGFCISMLDVDNFKRINDSYGHNKGDDILRFVSSTMLECIGKHGYVYRYGGDEFALIFLTPNAERAGEILESIRVKIAGNTNLFSDGSTMSISSGLYIVNELSMTAEQIFYRADQALYQAKFDGKNRCQIASS